MSRLTEKVGYGAALREVGMLDCTRVCKSMMEYDNPCGMCPIQEAVETLAHYEDLEEQGRLIELPCKVGDTVYLICNSINDSKWRLALGFYSVTDILLNVNREPLVRISNTYGTFKLSEFGKTVFLTREEAEAKLEELEGTEE